MSRARVVVAAAASAAALLAACGLRALAASPFDPPTPLFEPEAPAVVAGADLTLRAPLPAIVVGGGGSSGSGAEATAPLKLADRPAADDTVYAPPSPPTEAEGANTGGIHFDLTVRYLNDYLYRGVDRTQFIGAASGVDIEEKANFQVDAVMTFDLGKLPHPFIGVFANVLDEDPVQTFQEVRPVFGASLHLRPLILAGGNNTYIFPDRSELNTSEVWGKITLDDAAIFRLDKPFLSPYVYAAYDYDEYNGWYLEAGVSHDFVLGETGITLTVEGAVAAVLGHGAFTGPEGEDTGLHHYQLGVVGRYNLNQLLNIPQRFGRWSFNGYLYYADGLDDDLRSDTELWGGAGIQLSY